VKSAAFLDRDGVLNACYVKNKIPCPPSNILEVKILPGVKEAIELLMYNDYLPVVITNQPDITRGSTTLWDVQKINEYIGDKTGISHFYVCTHDNLDYCNCRKPKPGLIEVAVEELDIDLSSSFLVGDRWKDIEAGQAMGLPSFFIDYAYLENEPPQPFTRVSSLLNAVKIILEPSNEL
jgi:D-glycero-D-manno-heptose 1,7-bisphosphate phosphatase